VSEEKQPQAESVGLGEVTAILLDVIEVLRGIRVRNEGVGGGH
jgi:hypothetical protein